MKFKLQLHLFWFNNYEFSSLEIYSSVHLCGEYEASLRNKIAEPTNKIFITCSIT